MEEKMLVVESEETQPEVPAEKSEPKAVVGSPEAFKNLFSLTIPAPSLGTKPHNPTRIRGIGATRKSHEESKKTKKMAKKSRKINRGKK